MTGYGLTHQQRAVMRYLSSRDSAPSFEEIRIHLGLASKSGVSRIVAGLEERGYITRRPDRARSIELVRRVEPEAVRLPEPYQHDEVRHIPLLGRIS